MTYRHADGHDVAVVFDGRDRGAEREALDDVLAEQPRGREGGGGGTFHFWFTSCPVCT